MELKVIKKKTSDERKQGKKRKEMENEAAIVDKIGKKKLKKKKKTSGKNEGKKGELGNEQQSMKQIDDLFGVLKEKKEKKKKEKEEEVKKEQQKIEQAKLLKKQIEEAEKKYASKIGKDPRPVRYDADGLPIYSEASLRINQGGNTADCPFDCWCCF